MARSQYIYEARAHSTRAFFTVKYEALLWLSQHHPDHIGLVRYKNGAETPGHYYDRRSLVQAIRGGGQ